MTERGWGSKEFAEAWRARAEERRRNMAPLTEAMLAEARIAAGMRVLDLGTGTGDTAILAAERVGSGGAVLATDASQAMVEVASESVHAARAAGALTAGVDVIVRRMDASAMDVEEGTFDAVIARQVLMFVDRPRALAGVMRALKAGGRFAGTVWGPMAVNPYHGVTIEVARAHRGWGEPTPEMVRAFSVEDPDEWRRVLEGAGFKDVVVRAVAGERRFASAEEAIKAMRESPIHREPLERLEAGEREKAWAEIEAWCRGRGEGEAGGVFPTQHLVVAGGK